MIRVHTTHVSGSDGVGCGMRCWLCGDMCAQNLNFGVVSRRIRCVERHRRLIVDAMHVREHCEGVETIALTISRVGIDVKLG
jgi:hypothetical protein